MLIGNFVTSKDIDRETAKCKASFAYPEDGTRWARVGGLGLGSGLG